LATMVSLSPSRNTSSTLLIAASMLSFSVAAGSSPN